MIDVDLRFDRRIEKFISFMFPNEDSRDWESIDEMAKEIFNFARFYQSSRSQKWKVQIELAKNKQQRAKDVQSISSLINN